MKVFFRVLMFLFVAMNLNDGFAQVFEVSCNLKPQPIDGNWYVRSNPIVLTLKTPWTLDSAQSLYLYVRNPYVMFSGPGVATVTTRTSDFGANANLTTDHKQEYIKINVPKPVQGTYETGTTFVVRGITFDVWNGSDPNGCRGQNFLQCSEVAPGDFIGITTTSHDQREDVTFVNPEINTVRVAVPNVRR